MVINFSRASQFSECDWKALCYDKLKLSSPKIADPLLTGGAYHKGSAVLLSTGDLPNALRVAEDHVRGSIEGINYLPEELVTIEQGIEFAKRALIEYSKIYPTSGYKVLMPEVDLCVPIPGTEHHCYFVHKLLFPGEPCESSKCNHPQCWQPHYLRGTTDGVIEMSQRIWLLEQKTSSITGDIFYKRWALDMQPTIYMWGIKQATGIRPHGFLLNVIKKPNKRAADQLNIQIEREPFLRSDEELERAIRDISNIATDYEDMMSGQRPARHSGAWNGSCTKWNRTCYYYERCKRGDVDIEGEFVTRKTDYVDETYYKILNMEVPQSA